MKRVIFVSIFLYLMQTAISVKALDDIQIHCVTENTFAVHISIFNQIIDTALVLYCPANHQCVSNSRTPCQIKSSSSSTMSTSTAWSSSKPTQPTTVPSNTNRTTTIPTTVQPTTTTPPTTIAPIPEPECHALGYHRATKCNEYYECVQSFWWYKPMLRTCATGYFYSDINKPCDKPPNVICYF